MTPDQFWYEDIELMHIYFEAYQKRSERVAWIEGYYDKLALVDVIGKVISRNSKETFDYPITPLSNQEGEQQKIESKSEIDREKEFREAMLSVY